MKKILLVISLFIIAVSCSDDVQPKPKAYLALEFPPHQYKPVDIGCPFHFEINKIAQLKPSHSGKDCWFNIKYPSMNAAIYVSYQQVNNNLRKLLIDAQNLPLKHTIKAQTINGQTYINKERDVYGTFYKVTGDAASQAQFYLTDSTEHFLTGAVYFNLRPNYDSLLPAAHYIQVDIRHLMESVKWKN